MRTGFIITLLIAILTGISSCDFFQFKKQEKEKGKELLARVNGKQLTMEKIRGTIPASSLQNGDSAEVIQRYIRSWVRKQLMLKKAEASSDFNKKEMQRKIRDYEYALKVHAFKKSYIEKKLDTNLTYKEIKEYYDQHTKEFELKQNIIRGAYVKVSKEAPDQASLKKWLRTGNIKKLRPYCLRYANTYVISDSSWVKFDDLVINTPFNKVNNPVQFLKTHTFAQKSDKSFNYYLKIDKYKITDEVAPLPMVKDKVKNILINKRKVRLINELEESIYNKAKKENAFEILYSE